MTLTTLEAWSSLALAAASMKTGDQTLHLRSLLLDKTRSGFFAKHKDITMDYSRQKLTSTHLETLFSLADQSGLQDKIAAMKNGVKINETEDRAGE